MEIRVPLTMLLTIAVAAAAAAQTNGNPALGKQTYQKFCIVCHGPEGQGSPLGKALNTREAKIKSDSEIIDVITNGVPGTSMSSYESGLTQDEIFWTMLYIRELQGDKRVRGGDIDMSTLPPRPVISEEARRGEKLFSGKAGCIDCHSYHTRGGFLGPDLSQIGAVLSREELATALLQPSASIRPGFGSKQLLLNDGTRAEGRYRNETPETIQIANEDATLWRTYFKRDIKKMRDGRRSLMPGDYGERLTDVELAELLAFLESLK